jgi:hypothetical protein
MSLDVSDVERRATSRHLVAAMFVVLRLRKSEISPFLCSSLPLTVLLKQGKGGGGSHRKIVVYEKT